MINRHVMIAVLIGTIAANVATAAPPSVKSQLVDEPSPPLPGAEGWGASDELGNGNTQSPATRARCARLMLEPNAKVFELGYKLSATMPQSPFGDGLVAIDYRATFGLPGTRHAGNGEVFSGGIGSQGTQMDALGHLGFINEAWGGPASGPFPAQGAHYYNGFTQQQVKPDPAGPLQKLGIDKAPPIITSAVMLDVANLRGRDLEAGELITREDILAALRKQKLDDRGILPGDAVFIHTGWGKKWLDPAPNPLNTDYYSEGPGLSLSGQAYLASRTVVLIALDNPFTDPVRHCQLTGTCGPPEGVPADLPFSIHHNNLAVNGIHQIQNLDLEGLAKEKVSLSCAMVLPLRIVGAAGSAVRPVAVGAPRNDY